MANPKQLFGASSSAGEITKNIGLPVSGTSHSTGSVVGNRIHLTGSSNSAGVITMNRPFHLAGASSSTGALSRIIVPIGYVRFYYNSTHVDIKIRSEKGILSPESYSFYPEIINTYLDGSQESQIQSFIRNIEINLGVVADRNNRLALLYWLLDNDREIGYLLEPHIAVVPERSDGYENEWIENISLARKYVIRMQESITRKTFPVYS